MRSPGGVIGLVDVLGEPLFPDAIGLALPALTILDMTPPAFIPGQS